DMPMNPSQNARFGGDIPNRELGQRDPQLRSPVALSVQATTPETRGTAGQFARAEDIGQMPRLGGGGRSPPATGLYLKTGKISLITLNLQGKTRLWAFQAEFKGQKSCKNSVFIYKFPAQ